MSSDAHRRHPVPFAVGAVLLFFSLALAFRWWAERRIVGPWYLDEFVYAQSAREIASDWSRLVREFAAHYYLYPRLIAPAWLAGSMPTTYAVAKAINVVLITSAAVPLYLWARRVLSPWRSALVVALALALPTGLYSGLLVTENAFFPAFTLAVFLLALTLERPTPARQVLAVAAAALAYAVRVQGIVFLAIIPAAVVLKALFDARQGHERLSWRRFADHVRPYLLLLGLLAAGLVLYALKQLLLGGKLSSWVGAYGAAVNIHNYSPASALKWIVYHFGGIALAVGVVPFIAFVLLGAEAWRRETRMSAAECALTAVVVSAVFWLVVQTGIIASGAWSDRMSERYLFHAEPLLLLTLVVWISRGARRPMGALVVALAASLALVLTLPFEWLIGHPAIFSDAFSLVALNRFSQHVGGAHNLWLALLAIALVVAAAFAVAPRRVIAVFAPCLVLAYLVAASLAVPGPLRTYASGVRAGAQIGEPVDWIDRAAGRSSAVDLLYTGDLEPDRERMTVLQTRFWNRSVRILDQLAPLPHLCCMPRRFASIRKTGLVRPDGGPALPATYVVALPPLGEVAGTKAASAGPLTLVRAASPLRLLSRTAGVYSDGWMGAFATYDRFAPASRVRIVVSRAGWKGPSTPGVARIVVGPLAGVGGSLVRVTARRTWTVRSGSQRTFVLDAPRAPYRVAVHVGPTFSPSAFGLSDSRQLGAEVTFYSSTAIRSSTRRKTKAPSTSATSAAPHR